VRVTVGTVVGLLGAGHTAAEILKEYPYLEEEDLQSALTHAALRSEEVDLTLNRAG
jgi:uncharacterized protein (DUF433 family)